MIEWNDIEKTIAEHRAEFDIDMPGIKHEAVFFQKLDVFHHGQAVRKRWQVIRYAASFAAFFVTSVAILWMYYYLNYKHEVKYAVNPIFTEFNEASNYYTSQVDRSIEQLKILPFNEPQQIDSIFAELSVMDENKRQLYDELSENPNDERIMDAIINLYIVKLDAINQVVRSFSISQNNKTMDHENNI